jgi:hypothetical protein
MCVESVWTSLWILCVKSVWTKFVFMEQLWVIKLNLWCICVMRCWSTNAERLACNSSLLQTLERLASIGKLLPPTRVPAKRRYKNINTDVCCIFHRRPSASVLAAYYRRVSWIKAVVMPHASVIGIYHDTQRCVCNLSLSQTSYDRRAGACLWSHLMRVCNVKLSHSQLRG